MWVIGGNKKGVSRIFKFFVFVLVFGFDWAVVRSVSCSFIFHTFLLHVPFRNSGKKSSQPWFSFRISFKSSD